LWKKRFGRGREACYLTSIDEIAIPRKAEGQRNQTAAKGSAQSPCGCRRSRLRGTKLIGVNLVKGGGEELERNTSEEEY